MGKSTDHVIKIIRNNELPPAIHGSSVILLMGNSGDMRLATRAKLFILSLGTVNRVEFLPPYDIRLCWRSVCREIKNPVIIGSRTYGLYPGLQNRIQEPCPFQGLASSSLIGNEAVGTLP